MINLEWILIESDQDIMNIQKRYGNFLDAEIVNFRYESGNYVDSDLRGHEYMKNELHVIFQRMDENPFAIEVVFEEMRYIHFHAAMMDETSSDILYAQFIKTKDFIYWTNLRMFDPEDIPEYLAGGKMFIEAKRAKWRVVSEKGESISKPWLDEEY